MKIVSESLKNKRFRDQGKHKLVTDQGKSWKQSCKGKFTNGPSGNIRFGVEMKWNEINSIPFTNYRVSESPEQYKWILHPIKTIYFHTTLNLTKWGAIWVEMKSIQFNSIQFMWELKSKSEELKNVIYQQVFLLFFLGKVSNQDP
jgi:hypothetical protein